MCLDDGKISTKMIFFGLVIENSVIKVSDISENMRIKITIAILG
jgi:hypothetical protein